MENQLQKAEQFTINYFNAEHLNSVQRIATMFSASDLVPDIYKIDKVGKEKAIANCIIALDMASRLNANPLMIMQNLNIIKGKPGWSSKFLIATINTNGRFSPLKFKIESKGMIKNVQYVDYVWQNGRNVPQTKTFTDEVENITCYAYTTERENDEILQGSDISIEMAIKEGWYTKSGSKWQNMTKQMLMYRAASFWCSIYAPELSMGIKTNEENDDIIDVDHVNITPKNDINKFNMPDAGEQKTDTETKPKEQKSILDFAQG